MFENTRKRAAAATHEVRNLFGIPPRFIRRLGQLALKDNEQASLHPQAQAFLDQLALQQERYANRPSAGKNRVFKVSTTIEPDAEADQVLKDIYKHFDLELDSLALARTIGSLSEWRVYPANLSFNSLKVQRCLVELQNRNGIVVVPDNANKDNFSLLLAAPGQGSEARSFLALTGVRAGEQTEQVGLTYVEFMPKAE